MRYAYPLATPEITKPLLALHAPPEQACAQLAELGYTGIEPFVRDPASFDGESFARAIEASGMTVAAVGTGPVAAHDQLVFSQEATHEAAIARTRAIIAFAARFGAQVNIGKLRGPVTSPDDAVRRDEAFRQVCAYAAEQGVIITLEPQGQAVIDNLNTTAESLAWVRAMELPNLKLMLDSYHLHHEDPVPLASLVAAREVLWHIHFADTRRAVPGTGAIDFRAQLHVLHALGYDRFITVEIAQQPDSLTVAERAIRYLRTRESNLPSS